MLARLLLAALFAAPAAAEPFSFVALGDTTYAPRLTTLFMANSSTRSTRARPAFSIQSATPRAYGDCGRAFQESQLEFFNRFASAVFYTPGQQRVGRLLEGEPRLRRSRRRSLR
jgi:hypothetical protein